MARARKAARHKAARPRGRPRVTTPAVRKQILMILRLGLSRNDAADANGIGRSTLSECIASDEAFAEQVKKAEAAGKVRHMRKLGAAKAWQASAWFLERKYPDEYGRKVAAPPVGDEENASAEVHYVVTQKPAHAEPAAPTGGGDANPS